MSQIVEKYPISQGWIILQKIFGSASRRGWLPEFNQFLFVFFLVDKYISDNIVMKIRSVVFTWSC